MSREFRRHHDDMLDAIPVFLKFRPQHDTDSCSDQNPLQFPDGKCVRCKLLDLENDFAHYDDTKWPANLSVEMSITFNSK